MGFKVGDLVTTKEYIIGDNLYRIIKYDAMTRKYSLKYVGPEYYRDVIDCDIDDNIYIFSEHELELYLSYEKCIKEVRDNPFANDCSDYIDEFYEGKEPKRNAAIANLTVSTNLTLEEKSIVCENKKEEDKMLSIVENYKERKEKQIKNKYDKIVEDLENNDPIQKIISKAIEETNREIKKIYENENLNEEPVRINIGLSGIGLLESTLKEKNEARKSMEEELEKLHTEITNINSLLELAETYEQKMDILRAYDIVDKKGKIN